MPIDWLGRMDNDKPFFRLSFCKRNVPEAARKKQDIFPRSSYRISLGHSCHAFIAPCIKKNTMDADAFKKNNNAFYLRRMH